MRPTTTLPTIDTAIGGWNTVLDTIFDTLRDLLFVKPYPLAHVHQTTADEGSSPLASYPPADYKWCFAVLVDATTPATNGYMIFSDGTNWKYQRTHTNV